LFCDLQPFPPQNPSCFQVGTGDRSEKIKTYNYKDGRCSDHRLKMNFELNKVRRLLTGLCNREDSA
jgi:protein subunit release factor A